MRALSKVGLLSSSRLSIYGLTPASAFWPVWTPERRRRPACPRKTSLTAEHTRPEDRGTHSGRSGSVLVGATSRAVVSPSIVVHLGMLL